MMPANRRSKTFPSVLLAREGKDEFKRVIRAVRRACKENFSKQVTVFTSDGTGALELARGLEGVECRLFAVTFPFGRRFKYRGKDAVGGVVRDEIQQGLDEFGVKLVQAFPPFWEIPIGDVPDFKTTILREVLGLFGGGTSLCVQSILMACDQGLVAPGEDVIGVASDTAILASACFTESLFHPVTGMEIRAHLAKPGYFTTTKQKKYSPPETR